MAQRPIRFVWSAAALALAVAAVAGQQRQFEVASIHPSPEPGTQGATLGVRLTDRQVRMGGFTLKDYIGRAYSLDPPQVIAPDWANQLRFDISANLPDGATREQIPEMLQALLAQRFQLKVHKESREFPIYAIVVGRDGLKITPVPVDAAAPAATEQTGAGGGGGVSFSYGVGLFSMHPNTFEIMHLTMAELADVLTRFTERKTLDATGLTGHFDFTLELSDEDYQFVMLRSAVNNGFAVGPDGLRALDRAPSNVLGRYIGKTGLQIEPRRAPLDVIVLDSALKSPIEN